PRRRMEPGEGTAGMDDLGTTSFSARDPPRPGTVGDRTLGMPLGRDRGATRFFRPAAGPPNPTGLRAFRTNDVSKE
ncbi:MAG: hypothetical protein AVDCRST_MAG19-3960, partial [uncultured Thermomicrobiales bacterium]